ncbi:MAG: 4-diphosphocytidyl-2C-methyl-D-erythritol kinase, partial [Rhodospirillales bacterium]|nr:4-diphosphocytidyl-2C-methyl-D-erythritol kinase [Rhodospirillales bacterium]
MKFGPLPLSQAEGSILAHTTRVPGRVIKKGRLLDADDLAEMQEAGLKSLIVARLEEDDLGEDEAALAIAQALAGSNIRVSPPFTGRCNLF